MRKKTLNINPSGENYHMYQSIVTLVDGITIKTPLAIEYIATQFLLMIK